MRELFDQLRAEADRQILPEPALLRVRSDRRAARRMATGVLAVVLMLTGGFYAMLPTSSAVSEPAAGTPPAGWVEPSALPSPVASPTTVATAPTTCRDAFPKQIAEVAFVPGGTELCFDPVEPSFFVESIPTPCRPAARRTDPLIQDRRGFENIVTEDKTQGPTSIHQVLTRYSAQGATQFVSDLRDDVGRCGPFTTSELRLTYSIVTSDATSVKLAAKYEALKKSDAGPPVSTYLVMVRRVGSYVAVAYDKGWDGYPSEEKTLTSFFEALVRGVPPT